MTLVWPSQEYLAGYVAALKLGWSADNVRGRDAADEELAKIAADASAFRYVEITTDLDNVASQRVIEANGGRLVERFTKPAQFGSRPGLRYRIHFR